MAGDMQAGAAGSIRTRVVKERLVDGVELDELVEEVGDAVEGNKGMSLSSMQRATNMAVIVVVRVEAATSVGNSSFLPISSSSL